VESSAFPRRTVSTVVDAVTFVMLFAPKINIESHSCGECIFNSFLQGQAEQQPLRGCSLSSPSWFSLAGLEHKSQRFHPLVRRCRSR